jgi:hypothetical protein
MTPTYESPCPTGTAPIAAWSFCYDYDDDGGGGFVSGEYLLRSDGKLLRRMGYSLTGSVDGKTLTTWKFDAWQVDERWNSGTQPDKAIAWLKTKGYDLYEASPCPIDQPISPTIEGDRPPARYL